MDQIDSTHPGYRRTTITSGTTVYVSDYEEYGLVLMDPEPKKVVGQFGIGGNICEISGQPATSYLAVDEGSEMPAFAPFRNINCPPFNWRAAKFQNMEIANPASPNDHKKTADPALMDDVLSTVKNGTPAIKPAFDPKYFKKYSSLLLYPGDLPGLIFTIHVYADDDGQIYFGENLNSTQWIKASPVMMQWLDAR